MVNILLSFNKKYLMYAITLIINIIDKNVSKSKITFYCMCDNDVDTPAKELLQNVAKKYNVTIEIINVGNFFANAKEEGIHGRILNKAAYYRLFVLNEKINSNIDKILYLDLDTYINHDISELFNIDMEEHCLGGVIDPWANHMSKGFCNKYFYLNSGVVLYNLKRIRKMYPNVLDKIKEMIDDNSWAKNSKVFAHDQTIVNVVFNNNDKLMIAPKYNCVKPCVLNFWYRCYGFKLVHEAHKNPYIIHFSGPLHPWHNNVLHNKFYFAWMKYKKNWLINYNKALNEK